MNSSGFDTSEPPLALTTPRLTLRDVREADVDTIVKYSSEPAAKDRILAWQRDPDRVARHVRSALLYSGHYHWRMREGFVLGVCLRESGALVGYVSLLDAVPQGRAARIGWHFGSEYSGRGLATEAATEALRFAFEVIEVERMTGDCNQTNEASKRIFAKLGMRPFEDGYLRNRLRACRYRQPVPVARFMTDRNAWLLRKGT